MIANYVVSHPVAVRTAVWPRILQCRSELTLQQDVECDGDMSIVVETDTHGLQRFNDLILDRAHFGAGRVRRQPSTGTDRPLFGAPTHPGGPVEDAAIRVLADTEDHLQRVVLCMG